MKPRRSYWSSKKQYKTNAFFHFFQYVQKSSCFLIRVLNETTIEWFHCKQKLKNLLCFVLGPFHSDVRSANFLKYGEKLLWCFLCPWTWIFQALRHLSGFHHFFMCLWQLLVRFEISPFYQDFRFGSQTRFDNKSNAFIAVLDATIIKPMLLPLYFQNIQKYKKYKHSLK